MTRQAQRLSSLAELGGAWTQQALAVAREQAHLAALVAAARALDLERQAQSAHGLFVRSVGPVTPLPASGNALIVRRAAPPHPRQRELDEQAAVRESMSDEVNLESLLLTDDGLSYRRPGIAPDVVTRLRKGQWTLQGQIDLHGHNRDEARQALAEFIRQCQRRSLRCLRVVHGKGHGSPGREPVLKARVQRWLAQCAPVVAFAQASGPQGGAGALLVLLSG